MSSTFQLKRCATDKKRLFFCLAITCLFVGLNNFYLFSDWLDLSPSLFDVICWEWNDSKVSRFYATNSCRDLRIQRNDENALDGEGWITNVRKEFDCNRKTLAHVGWSIPVVHFVERMRTQRVDGRSWRKCVLIYLPSSTLSFHWLASFCRLSIWLFQRRLQHQRQIHSSNRMGLQTFHWSVLAILRSLVWSLPDGFRSQSCWSLSLASFQFACFNCCTTPDGENTRISLTFFGWENEFVREGYDWYSNPADNVTINTRIHLSLFERFRAPPLRCDKVCLFLMKAEVNRATRCNKAQTHQALQTVQRLEIPKSV